MRVEPWDDRIVVRPVSEEQVTASGIVIPDTARERPHEAEVLAIGPKLYDDAGNPKLSEGDVILYSKYAGTEIKIDGDDLLVLREHDVIARLKPDEGSAS